jgi:hypothetical protein
LGYTGHSSNLNLEVKEMPVTITLNDNLAVRLRSQAHARQLSLEQWTLTLLGQVADDPQEFQTWATLNQRRGELIRLRYTTGLSEAEEKELEQLQSTVDRLLEPWDQQLSQRLASYEAQAAHAPTHPND